MSITGVLGKPAVEYELPIMGKFGREYGTAMLHRGRRKIASDILLRRLL